MSARLLFFPRRPGTPSIQWHPKNARLVHDRSQQNNGVECAHGVDIPDEGGGYTIYYYPKKPVHFYEDDYGLLCVSENPDKGGVPLLGRGLCVECCKDLQASALKLLNNWEIRVDEKEAEKPKDGP